jgi:hypothetical protein
MRITGLSAVLYDVLYGLSADIDGCRHYFVVWTADSSLHTHDLMDESMKSVFQINPESILYLTSILISKCFQQKVS